MCVNMYIKSVCGHHTGQKRKGRRKKTLKRQFRDGVWGSSRGYVTVGWMYGERNVLENERLYRARYFLFCLKWQKSELFSSFKTSLPTKMMNHLNPGEAVPLKRFKGHHHTLHRSRVSVSLCLQGFTHTHTRTDGTLIVLKVKPFSPVSYSVWINNVFMEESSYFYCILPFFLTLWMHDFFFKTNKLTKKKKKSQKRQSVLYGTFLLAK